MSCENWGELRSVSFVQLENRPDATATPSVAIVGTFDVENYGDLLFPLIADAELRRRCTSIDLVPFSVNGRSVAQWPYEVHPTRALAEMMPGFSALLIGGGQIIRFDDVYPIAAPPGTKMPIDYWLVPALIGALNGKPVFWNAPGVLTRSSDAPWLSRPLAEALRASRFVGVRDEVSLSHLRRLAPDAELAFLPDTAFGISRLWPLHDESPQFSEWRDSIGLQGRYALVQGSPFMHFNRRAIERQLKSLGLSQLVVLPICRCHGDNGDNFPDLPDVRVVRSREWPQLLLIAEIVARSEFLFASSLHACITAISYGVPAARAFAYTDRKFELLDGFEGVASIDDEAGLARLAARGRRIEPRAIDYADRLSRYWDQVAEAIAGGDRARDDAARLRMVDLFIDGCDARSNASMAAKAFARAREPFMSLMRRRDEFRFRVMGVRQRIGRAARALWLWGGQSEQSADEQRGKSGEASGPGAGSLNIAAIESLEMEEVPYRWAFVEGLFSPEDALHLARTFPRDRFRRVAGYDGEKGYEYLSRSLVHMGAGSATAPERLSPQWRALITDLLSDGYRDAVSRATGLDLSEAVVEVNAIRFGPGAWLGPHVDLKEKIATHILYFSEEWDPANGGCLHVLNSRDESDRRAEILPLAGNSALLVRSERSWHAVSPVAKRCNATRKNINVIFHLPGSVSTMWPSGEKHRLVDCAAG